MENATSTNPNRTWAAIVLGVIVVCVFIFLSVCVIAFSFVAVRISEEQKQAFLEPTQPEIRVVKRAEQAAGTVPRGSTTVAEKAQSESASPLQKDQPVTEAAMDRIPAEFDAKEATLDHMAKQLAMRLRSAKPDQQPQLLQELEILNEQHFEYRQHARKQELDRLSSRIDALRNLQLRRQDNKAEVLKRRLKDLTDPNADLNWEERRSANDRVSGRAGDVADSNVKNPLDLDAIAEMTLPPVAEKTFDGIAYSRWLKMLETERKPEKLATAIDACSRLAEPVDKRRIVRGILIAASLFEMGESQDRGKVWGAGWTGLNRLPPTAVVEELMGALRDEGTYKSGRQFQGEFLATKTDPELDDVLKSHADVLIGELVRLSYIGGKDTDYFLAAASSVWEKSKRRLVNFDGLEPRLVKMIEDGPTNGSFNETFFNPWSFAATKFTSLAPETPGLALMLVKHAESGTVVSLLGDMGHHAEPAVPALVNRFLDNWSDWENRNRDVEGKSRNRGQVHRSYEMNPANLPIVDSLGKIGVGVKGYALLRQLALFFDLPRGKNDPFFAQWAKSVEKSLLKFDEVPTLETPLTLLADRWLINGRWNLRSIAPGGVQDGTIAIIKFSQIQLVSNGRTYRDITKLIGGHTVETGAPPRFDLDQSTTPKTFFIFRVATQNQAMGGETREVPNSLHFGIYELTETTLRIQFSPLGEPHPLQLVAEKSELPKGQFLLEFDRKLDEEYDKGANPK